MECWNVWFPLRGKDCNVISCWERDDAVFLATLPLGDDGSAGTVLPSVGDFSDDEKAVVDAGSTVAGIVRMAVRYLQPPEILKLADFLGRF